MNSLTKSQISHLRGLAHKYKPIVMVGQAGPSDAVVQELDTALEHHELLKVKILTQDRDAVAATASALADRTGAIVVQTIGHTVIFYRPAQTPKLTLPK